MRLMESGEDVGQVLLEQIFDGNPVLHFSDAINTMGQFGGVAFLNGRIHPAIQSNGATMRFHLNVAIAELEIFG